MAKGKFAASVWCEGRWFIAQCLEVDVASQGRSESAALKNLADALRIFRPVSVTARARRPRPHAFYQHSPLPTHHSILIGGGKGRGPSRPL